jgi:hypothetical protein
MGVTVIHETKSTRNITMLEKAQSFSSSGERRLLACSVRQLAERILAQFSLWVRIMFAASCRELQAGSLRSPDLPNQRFSIW